MSDEINRRETTYVNPVDGTAKCTAQWLLEKRNVKGKITHPISHNNKLTMFICGKDGFGDIAKEIRKSKKSIDLCCWGFDPGMELERQPGLWPRGETYGDILIAAGRRGVKVRLLVWFDWLGKQAGQVSNMPGFTHEGAVWCVDGWREPNVRKMSAENSVAKLRTELQKSPPRGEFMVSALAGLGIHRNLTEADIPLLARQEYCFSWFRAAFSDLLTNIEIRTHTGDTKSIKRQLQGERTQPRGAERLGFVHFGTHHQKPVLIDFDYDNGSKAVGYVMGLNSVTDYWDTPSHSSDDAQREALSPAQIAKADASSRSYTTAKPLRDYACRIDRGAALIGLHNNFASGWNRAGSEENNRILQIMHNSEPGGLAVPTALLHAAGSEDSTVQIIRTQPAEQDHTIREIHFKAADNASLAFRYLYIENQYFQYEEWTSYLIGQRRKVIELWNKARAKEGKSLSEMPILHVFLVIPLPERLQMIPRTYDALAHLGQQGAMIGQQERIDKENDRVKAENFAPWYKRRAPLANVVKHANGINKPDSKMLENLFGLKICTAMLNACGPDGKGWKCREIYIHSKLLLIDDVFCTLGSANLNQRSMIGDSELNMATIDAKVVTDLRKRVWAQLSGGEVDGGGGTKEEVSRAFDAWKDMMQTNGRLQAKKMLISGFIVPLLDERSSTSRLG